MDVSDVLMLLDANNSDFSDIFDGKYYFNSTNKLCKVKMK